MAPSKFDLMKDMDEVLREAERERVRARVVSARHAQAAALKTRPAFPPRALTPALTAFSA